MDVHKEKVPLALITPIIKRLRDSGTGISSSIVLAVAEGYIMQRNKTVLMQYGGHVELTHNWALSLLARLGFVKRRATTKPNNQLCEEKFQNVKRPCLNQIASMVHIHNIPAELVMNLDQTGNNLVPAGNWTMAPQGSTRVALAGVGDKRQHLLALSVVLSSICSSCTKEKQTTAIQNSIFRKALMYTILPTTGLLRKPHFGLPKR